MRIVIDMQGAQTESRFRGIGRYTIGFVQGVVRNRGKHEVILALNGLFPETIEPIREAFEGLLPQECIRVWYAPGPVRETSPLNCSRREIAENVREAFIQSLQPNFIVVTSLFEGLGDDAVTSIGRFDRQTPVAVILYDLIPLISPDIQFQTNPVYKEYFSRKIKWIKNSSLLLAISESSKKEAIKHLGWDVSRIINISSSFDEGLKPQSITESEADLLYAKIGLTKPFLMYAGGADERKNLSRLIRAFAKLPRQQQDKYQLLIAGKMPSGNVADLKAVAKQVGVSANNLLFSGYVTDIELVQLYSACHLFVFPSLHEGFGLPPLEAMACGAPVITSNVTSLPEVIGRADATFDPNSCESISKKIEEVLANDEFRDELSRYGAHRAKDFSWDKCATLAIEAIQALALPKPVIDEPSPRTGSLRKISTSVFPNERVKKILVIKLDHMGDWILAIPAISKLRMRYPYAEIDAMVGSWNVQAAEELDFFNNIYVYDFFSKSSSVAPSVKKERLSELVSPMTTYDLAIDMRRQQDTRNILLSIPARRHVGYATQDVDINKKLQICLPTEIDEPYVKTSLNCTPMAQQIMALIDSIPPDAQDFVSLPKPCNIDQTDDHRIAIFPHAGNDVKEWGDHNFRALIDLLLYSPHVKGITLYVMTTEDGSAYQDIDHPKFSIEAGLDHSLLVSSLKTHSICVANNSYGAHLSSYLGLSVVGVYGGHETAEEWGPAFGKTIVIQTPVECSPCHISRREDCKFGIKCLEGISPYEVFGAVKSMYTSKPQALRSETADDILARLVDTTIPLAAAGNVSIHELASCFDRSVTQPKLPQLYLDISELVQFDAGTGIQRVVRSVLKEWLCNPPEGYQVEPVYATVEQGYRYAKRFTQAFLNTDEGALADEPIDYAPGDIFFGLDLQPQVQVAQRGFYQKLRREGVQVKFMVYDLLSILMPQYFPLGSEEGFSQWLSVVVENDGAVCISKTVADDLSEWFEQNGPKRQRPFVIDWLHLGADVDHVHPTQGLPLNSDETLAQLRLHPTFLMVGTLEPRKGYAQVLDAFEQLWQSGTNFNLAVVGKQGWMVDELAERLRAHQELNKRLFWLQGISDEYLEKVYASSTCLIAASYGEGFGLPLIEAAQHKLPIIARDIPVFREVAGEHAYYFDSATADGLSQAIIDWLKLYRGGRHPKSDKMPKVDGLGSKA